MQVIKNPFLGSVPLEGPKALKTFIEVVPPARTLVDLKLKFNTGLFAGCQTLFVDGVDLTDDLFITTSLGQRILIKKGTQGYYSILEGAEMTFYFESSSYQKPVVFFLNQAIATCVWGVSGTGITELPIASATELGGIKVGQNLSIDEDGVLNAAGGGGGGSGIDIYNSCGVYYSNEDGYATSFEDLPDFLESATVSAAGVEFVFKSNATFLMIVEAATNEPNGFTTFGAVCGKVKNIIQYDEESDPESMPLASVCPVTVIGENRTGCTTVIAVGPSDDFYFKNSYFIEMSNLPAGATGTVILVPTS